MAIHRGTKKEAGSDLDRCKSIFVPWSWTTVFISSFIVVAIASTMIYQERETKQDEAIKNIKIESIHADLDTIKNILRNK
jgi:hypothetical protein